MPVAPDLSHYFGRQVMQILSGSGMEGDPIWTLVLAGDIAVQNYDDTLPMPGQHIVGQLFTNMSLAPNVTSMFFGGLDGNTVSLNPVKYAIGSSITEKPYYPQVSEANPNWQPPPEPEQSDPPLQPGAE